MFYIIITSLHFSYLNIVKSHEYVKREKNLPKLADLTKLWCVRKVARPICIRSVGSFRNFRFAIESFSKSEIKSSNRGAFGKSNCLPRSEPRPEQVPVREIIMGFSRTTRRTQIFILQSFREQTIFKRWIKQVEIRAVSCLIAINNFFTNLVFLFKN